MCRRNVQAKFAGDMYNATGLAFVIKYDDAQAYDLPYQEEVAANVALAATMDKCDWKGLLNKVDYAYCGWKVPTSLLVGNAVRNFPTSQGLYLCFQPVLPFSKFN